MILSSKMSVLSALISLIGNFWLYNLSPSYKNYSGQGLVLVDLAGFKNLTQKFLTQPKCL